MQHEIPQYPFVTADQLGPARLYDIWQSIRTRRNGHAPNEMHFSVQQRTPTQGFKHTAYGWLTRNELMDSFTDRLFQERYENQHIEFIEWEDRINCVVRDGMYISQTNFYMTKLEFQKFLDRAAPTKDMEVCV